MDQKQFDAVLSDAEIRLRRLKTLYEQWFMGIERVEPALPRKELEDMLTRLRKEQVSNTAQRFRLQQLVQRHVSFSTHWRRIGRQIEEGTFQRDLLRARRRAQQGGIDRSGDGPELEVSYDVDIDIDLDDVLEEANRAAEQALASRASDMSDHEAVTTRQSSIPAAGAVATRTFAAIAAPASPPVAAGVFGAKPAVSPMLAATSPPSAAGASAAERALQSAAARAGAAGVPLGLTAAAGANQGAVAQAFGAAGTARPLPAAVPDGPIPMIVPANSQLKATAAVSVPATPPLARNAAAAGLRPPAPAPTKPKPLVPSPEKPMPPHAPALVGQALPAPGPALPGGKVAGKPLPPPAAAAGAGQPSPTNGASPRSGPPRAISPFALPASGSLRPKPIEPPKPPPPPPAITSTMPGIPQSSSGAKAPPPPAAKLAAAAAKPAPKPLAAAKPAAAPMAHAVPHAVPKVAPTASAGPKPSVDSSAGAFSASDVERVYSQYVAARHKNAERVDNVKRDTIEKTIRGMLPQLEKKHAGKKIDFEVVVRDGKVALKPVAK